MIPDFQIGFRNQHGTIVKIHRVDNKINRDLKFKVFCSAAFLNIFQAFDKIGTVDHKSN